MTERPRAHEDIDRVLDLIHTTVDRTHQTIERATSQGTKILATAHAGLGVILAAWLQHIFESPDARLTPLLWYLAASLAPVMLGLLTVGLVCFGDIRCAQFMTDAATKQYKRLIAAKGWTAPPTDEERARGAALGNLIEESERSARWWDTGSQWASAIGWVLLAAAFAVLGTGVLVMVNQC
jgi:hypothetical protein